MDELIKSAVDILTPVMEGSMVLAAHYAKSCGRDTVTALDVKYSMRYGARNMVGKHFGTMFPELQGSDSDSGSDMEEVDEAEEPFTRYTGSDPQLLAVNEAYDTWDQWEPQSPVEKMLKNAIDQNE
jgi:histone H3/H4